MAHAPATVVDAYAGAGDVALVLASRGVQVTAIELDDEATAFSAARLPAGSRAIAARVEDAIGAALPADVVILNPPRAGVDARVTRQLAVTVDTPRAIVYVSCDPATLARDVARLPGWRIASLTAFDMFPQTAHVETVCELVREVIA
jgi:23S rRNA (uracil1939-C5)-methyltransferase